MKLFTLLSFMFTLIVAIIPAARSEDLEYLTHLSLKVFEKLTTEILKGFDGNFSPHDFATSSPCDASEKTATPINNIHSVKSYFLRPEIILTETEFEVNLDIKQNPENVRILLQEKFLVFEHKINSRETEEYSVRLPEAKKIGSFICKLFVQRLVKCKAPILKNGEKNEDILIKQIPQDLVMIMPNQVESFQVKMPMELSLNVQNINVFLLNGDLIVKYESPLGYEAVRKFALPAETDAKWDSPISAFGLDGILQIAIPKHDDFAKGKLLPIFKSKVFSDNDKF